MLAIKKNEAAVIFISNIDEDKKILFLKTNVLVMKYFVQDIPVDKVEAALKEVLSKEDVSEKYVKDFVNLESISVKHGNISTDRIIFIHKYGSKKSKKIAVDEKLTIR